MMFIKKFFFVFFFILTSLFGLAEDKTKHMQTSMIINYTGQTLLQEYGNVSGIESVMYATGITLVIGLGKEMYDEADYGGFSSKDLAADVIGVFGSALLTSYFAEDYFFRIEHDTTQKKSKIIAEYKF